MKGMQSALASPNLNSSYTSRSGSPFPSLPSSPPLSSTDDVTTIFVVGFPDDMQEREFQNMFMFAKGFEAASLKWHCKDQQEDQDMCHATLNNKKQMIGFARFRTRYEAIEATNEINGKKIDMEKGCILKAEMAKKNLHIKRAVNPSTPTTTTTTTTNTTTTTHNMNHLLSSAVQLPEPSSSPMTILTRNLSQAHPEENNRSQANSMDYESFLPLPSDLLSPTGNYKHDPFLLNDHHSFNDSLFCIRSHSYDGRNQNYQGDTTTAITPFQFFSKSELDTDPFHYMSKSTPVPHHDSPSQLFNHQVEDLGLKGRKNSLHTIERSSSALSNSFRTTATAASCSANQNPPCNTLYVGNLPPSTSEDELRSLFETCEGYKRMCFRNKPQGPMCFVEFEDVIYAAQAMNEHQGHLLSNSVKGGIRLSFSKNPLFIKPSKEADISFNFKQMGTALLADL